MSTLQHPKFGHRAIKQVEGLRIAAAHHRLIPHLIQVAWKKWEHQSNETGKRVSVSSYTLELMVLVTWYMLKDVKRQG